MNTTSDSLAIASFAIAVFLLGGFVKGVVGLGLPTIAMGLLSTVMPPAQAATLLIVPSLLTNLFQIGGSGLVALLRRLGGLLAGVCAGVAVGAGWLTSGGAAVRWAGLGMGVALTVYAGLGLTHRRFTTSLRHEPWAGPLAGFATGLVTAATGVFVIPAVPYLQSLGLEKNELVRALGVSFLVSTIALGLALGGHGALQASALSVSALATLPALLGMWAGQRLRATVPPEAFRRVFFLGLLVLGLYLMASHLSPRS